MLATTSGCVQSCGLSAYGRMGRLASGSAVVDSKPFWTARSARWIKGVPPGGSPRRSGCSEVVGSSQAEHKFW